MQVLCIEITRFRIIRMIYLIHRREMLIIMNFIVSIDTVKFVSQRKMQVKESEVLLWNLEQQHLQEM